MSAKLNKDLDSGPPSPKRVEYPYWPTIGHWNSVPLWLRDNEYIVTGHPLPTFSFRKSFRLWRCLHNETANIYSHFLGAALGISAGIWMLSMLYSGRLLNVSTGDRFAFGLYFTASSTCFGFSSAFHTLRSHSYRIHHLWGRMDILGINLLALGGGASATYYAFYCDTRVRWIYWGLILAAATATSCTLIMGAHRSPKWRTFRGAVFAMLGISAMLPIFHSICLLGWEQAKRQIGAQWFLAEGLSLLTGVAIFVSRFPERFGPGSFDIWGGSHQLFHLCAVLASAFHVTALVTGFQYSHDHFIC